MRRARSTLGRLAPVIAALAIVPLSIGIAGQERFTFVVSATDAEGKPVTGLMPTEVVMTENGAANEIVKVEPFRIPVELTIAVDNGPLGAEALPFYRSGLSAMVKVLPPEVEVTLITTAPQPRTVLRPTTAREQILKGINGFAPESESPRFTDALVEFSRRYQKELDDTKKADSLPVLLLLSTTANEVSNYQVAEVQKALGFLQARKAKVYVTMTAPRQDVQALSGISTLRQALIAMPATKATGGRFETLALSNRLDTLLPEIGTEIATLHAKLYNQMLVTVQRRQGVSGPLQNPRIELTRQGLTGQVSLDGLP